MLRLTKDNFYNRHIRSWKIVFVCLRIACIVHGDTKDFEQIKDISACIIKYLQVNLTPLAEILLMYNRNNVLQFE